MVRAKRRGDSAKSPRNKRVWVAPCGGASYPHVVAETLNRHFGIKMEAVHYRGEALMWQDVASNAIQGGSGSIARASSVLQTRTRRPIAVPSMARAKKRPHGLTFYDPGRT